MVYKPFQHADKLAVYVVTGGRPQRQITSDLLCEAKVDHVVVQDVGDNIESNRYRIVDTYLGEPGIRAKRQYILDGCTSARVLMFDDDLTFRKRLPPAENSFRRATLEDVQQMIKWFDLALRYHAHAGMIDEFMCHTQPRGSKTRGRYNQVLGYNLSLFPLEATPEDRCRFRLEINEEHDLHLQLGAHGLAPSITCEWTKSSKFYAEGGCARWRTAEVELAGHEALARNFPDLVRVVQDPKSLSGHAIRVKWAKAVRT